MQEIALFLTGIAGVATAAAYKKFPKTKSQLKTLGVNPHIQSKIHSLQVEKNILTKTISRLYQHDAGLTEIQKDRLLSKYQHQLGIVLAQIEKLEQASKHPDMGPLGDGLVTLMDQKLSILDQRLYELSSKIATANVAVPEIKKEKGKEVKTKSDIKIEKSIPEFKIKKPIQQVEHELPKPTSIPTFDLPKQRHPVEITTLTKIPNIPLEFPLLEQKKTETKNEIANKIVKPKEKIEDTQLNITSFSKPEIIPETPKHELPQQLPKPEPTNQPQLDKPKPSVSLPEDDNEEEDSDDLDKIKNDIMKTLSKLEQAEVE